MNPEELENRIEELSSRLDEQSQKIITLKEELETVRNIIPVPPLDVFFLTAIEQLLERNGKLAGWTFTPENIKSPNNSDGFALTLDATIPSLSFGGGVTIKNTATPFSGSGGLSIEHDTGEIDLEVSGQGVGAGSQQVLINANGEFFGVFVNTTAWFETDMSDIRFTALPTSSPGGSGKVWNNLGVLNIT